MKRYLIGAVLALLAGCAAAQTAPATQPEPELQSVIVLISTSRGTAAATVYAVSEKIVLTCFSNQFPLPARVNCFAFTGARFTEGPLELEAVELAIFTKPAGT